jgi:hypothetical protein
MNGRWCGCGERGQVGRSVRRLLGMAQCLPADVTGAAETLSLPLEGLPLMQSQP